MALMIRKQVYIQPEQEAQLKQLAAESGMSEAEIIRAAIDRQLTTLRGRLRDTAAWEAEQEFMRRRAAQGPLPGERTWTREELYDRPVLRGH